MLGEEVQRPEPATPNDYEASARSKELVLPITEEVMAQIRQAPGQRRSLSRR